MFLKRLEVIGFKSFAERIGIDFVPGVTAVVGPNGSGKSNVTDAIRWVLGEQSAKSLRGAKMEDVIFAGSESRKPLNFAEVTLILDNEDERVPLPYNEVSVTRRVYRSGDSEYLLNKQQCRLKDITDLFMDSGLGKEAFSIISQGRVDEILNSRPDDRRSIFEEAAGVLKYKQRKKKAEHKLFETEDNLHRVLDILHELDGRMEPLQMQASAASDFLRMSQELKDVDIAVAVHDLAQLSDSLSTLNEESKQLMIEEEKYAQEIFSQEQKLSALRKQLITLDGVIDSSQEELVEASSEVERWEGRKLLMAEKRHNADQQLRQLEQSVVTLETEKGQLQKELEEKQAAFEKRRVSIQEAKQAIKQLDTRLNRSEADIELEIEEQKNTYIDRLNEEASLKNELKNIQQQLEQQRETTAKMSGQSNLIEKELETIQQTKEDLQKQLANLTVALANKLESYRECQEKRQKVQATFEEKQSMLFKAYQHQQQMKARKESLEELEADFSGFFHGVKEVLIARDRQELTGIDGAVAELIQVKGEYAKAVETALGAAMQYIVTETESDAQKAIAWLKAKRVGRATFLPKTVMKSRKIASYTISTVTSHPAFINTADELADFAPEYRHIAENLLGNVLVAKDLQGASQIAKACQYRYRVVTLDGDVVNTGGSLTGGATKQQSSLFSRKAELEDLSANLGRLGTTIEQAEKNVAEKKHLLTQITDQLEELRREGEELRAEEFKQSAHCRELEAEEKRLKAQVVVVESEHSDATGRTSNLTVKKEQAEERLVELRVELQQINESIEQLLALKSQGETERDSIREQVAQKRADLAVAEEQASQLRQICTNLSAKMQELTQKTETYVSELQWMKQSEASIGPSDEEIITSIQQWQLKKETLLGIIQKSKGDRAEQQQQLEQLELALKELQRIHKGYLEALRSCEVKQNRIDVEMTSLLSQLEETYHLTFDEAQQIANEELDIEQSRKKVKLLKQSIEELGPVNVNAIEEFERVSERHVFLTEQRTDLLEAKETLHEAIREMDEEMTIRFGETFYAIRQQFQRVFRELFGGGQADLILTEPSDLLDTGIEIVAQPPGKKLQNLSLLSGGERALTAIALLFAILNIRPVPFCILDEVEAALDESNVVRYSQYLKKFSQETQFIVITHRKGTMEGADVLYGITMQESGVSKLVSVKLEEEPVLVAQGSDTK